jgi:hypothetical protein
LTLGFFIVTRGGGGFAIGGGSDEGENRDCDDGGGRFHNFIALDWPSAH